MTKQLVFILILFLHFSNSNATNYYCDPVNGNNSNTGLSSTTAYGSLSGVINILLNQINGGDTVFLLKGNHGAVIDISGKLVFEKKILNKLFLIEDISYIKNGIYFVVLNNSYAQKIYLK